jgi:hypothetical protein
MNEDPELRVPVPLRYFIFLKRLPVRTGPSRMVSSTWVRMAARSESYLLLACLQTSSIACGVPEMVGVLEPAPANVLAEKKKTKPRISIGDPDFTDFMSLPPVQW